MIKNIYEYLKTDTDTRKNLIQLKELLKEAENRDIFLQLLDYDFTLLRTLLSHTDAKTRKNTVMIISLLELEGLVPDLVEAYEEEETLFVKSAYLKALYAFSYEQYVPILKARFDELVGVDTEDNDKKHINEEIRELSKCISKYDYKSMHRFISYDEPGKVVLTTNRNHQNVTMEQLKKYHPKKLSGGVSITYDDLREVQEIRTYSEILFPLPSAKSLSLDPAAMAHTIMMAGILEFLESRHLGDEPFRFRVELRSRLDADDKRIMVKKIASELENLSKHQLVNSTSNYEVEIRLLETKNATFNVYLKLYTMKDHRFDYRKESLPTSINPVTAATIMELARPYLKEDAQVLDPFCGTGTMLIERYMAKPAHPMYGVDIFAKAIDIARDNTQAAGLTINYINRDFENFTHEYRFDEIVTNMPGVIGVKTIIEIKNIYAMFFEKISEVLKDQAILILYSSNPELINKELRFYENLKVLAKHEIYHKEGSYLFILQYEA